jgi:uncharacterized membrane protein YkoI
MRLLASLLCSLLLLSAAPAWADVSRDEAAAIARRQTDGRVLSVDRVDGGRRGAWRVKVLTSRGEVRVIFVDAATGQAG